MDRFCSMYEPLSSLTALRLAPVAVCVAVTSAPGRTAPVWSFTEPLIWAVACAQVIVAANDKKTAVTSTLTPTQMNFCIIDLPPAEQAVLSPFSNCFYLGGGQHNNKRLRRGSTI